jgi:hypothetical protein
MAKKEGVWRIVITGRLIVLLGITLGALYTIMAFRGMSLYSAVLYGASVAVRVVAFGGLVWVAGWIAEGFTSPDA